MTFTHSCHGSKSAALTGGEKVRANRIYQISPLQKELFSQFNRCATKHPHAECCHHYILSCGRYMFRAPRLPHSNSAQEPLCPVLVLRPLENFVLNLTVCALPVLLLALRKWAKVAIPNLYFPLPKRGKHYFNVLVFQNLFFQKSTRVANCGTAREVELQNERIFHHPSTALRVPLQ